MTKQAPALLLIDIQQGFEDIDYWGGGRNNPDAEENAGRLLQIWRDKAWPIFHVKHNSVNPASPLVKGKAGNAIHPAVTPKGEEPLFEKTVNSAFIGTDLEPLLKEKGITQLVVVGMTTDHCISTSVRMASNLGFDTYLVEDATATFDKLTKNGKRLPAETIHEVELASLDGEFVEVLSIKEVKKKWDL